MRHALGGDVMPDRVIVTDLEIPFGSMVVLLVKIALASIPALLCLAAIFGMLFVILGAVFGGLGMLLGSAQ